MGFNDIFQPLINAAVGSFGGAKKQQRKQQKQSKHYYHPDDDLLPEPIYVGEIDCGEAEAIFDGNMLLEKEENVAATRTTTSLLEEEEEEEDFSSTTSASSRSSTTTSTRTSPDDDDRRKNRNNNGSNKSKKFVSLQDGDLVVHQVLHHDDYTPTEYSATWYNEYELLQIKQQNKHIVDTVMERIIMSRRNQILHGGTNNVIIDEAENDDAADADTDTDNTDEDDYFCMRGLENMTKTGSKLRIRFRDTSRQIVLQEQEKYKIQRRLALQRLALSSQRQQRSQGGCGDYNNNHEGDNNNDNDNNTQAEAEVETERIAELYKMASDRCTIFAVTLGKNDERIAQQIYYKYTNDS